MKLVFLQEPDFPTAITAWNTDDTAESLRSQGIDCESIAMHSHAVKPEADVFIFYRTMSVDSLLKMREFQALGKPCGFMIDDLIWDPRFPFAYHESYERTCRQFFSKADFFVFTSDKLASVAKPLFGQKPFFIRRPGILERRFQELDRLASRSHSVNDSLAKRPFKILISKGHITEAFKGMIKQIFAETEELPHSQVFYFSVENLFPSLGGHVETVRLNPCDFDQYLREIAKIAPDLVLCPLEQSEFNDCKCYPKYLEAGGLSAALLVSDVYPYKKIIDQGVSGILAESDHELASLLFFASKNRGWIKALGFAARKDVEANHLLGPIALEFYNQLKERYGWRR